MATCSSRRRYKSKKLIIMIEGLRLKDPMVFILVFVGLEGRLSIRTYEVGGPISEVGWSKEIICKEDVWWSSKKQ